MSEQRRERLRARLDVLGIDAMLVAHATNRRYMTGFKSTAGWVVVGREQAVFMTDFRYIERAKQEIKGYEVILYDDPLETLDTVLQEMSARRVGFEGEHTTVKEHRGLMDLVPSVEWAFTESVVEGLRAIKEPGEIELLRRAATVADKAFDHILGVLGPGKTEKEISWQLERFMREEGAEALAFPSIVAAGPNGAFPHAVPSDRKIAQGDLVTMDFGCVWEGYCSDMTRTVAVGDPGERGRKLYELVLRSQNAGLDGVAPGRAGKAVDAMARQIIADAGYGKYFGHGLGHGIGLDVHEDPPRLSPKSDSALAVGMVTSVEPGIYIEGWGGIRIEDLALVTENGHEVLSKSPKELIRL